jgi:DNA-binding transcriptional LysR family regulator
MDNIDLRLLGIFERIYKTQNISQAAELLDLGQPAVSMGLAKLRAHFQDPLFVRTSRGMEPTPFAQELIEPVRDALALLKTALGHQSKFDPSASNRMFKICMTDVGQRVVMPKLLEQLNAIAPSIGIDLTYVTERAPKMLEAGEVDIAIGFLSNLDAGFFQQRLFNDRFVCIAHIDHPRIRHKKLTLKQFAAETHLVVATQGTGHNVLERRLTSLKIKRRVGLRIPNYLGVASMISNSNYLATVPERFGLALAETGNVRVLQLPFDIPAYSVMQHWHERYSRDLGIKWLRNVIADLFIE